MNNWSLGIFALLFAVASDIKAQTLEFSSQSDDAGEDQASVTLTVV